jgi:LysM repeat protein
MNFEYCNGETHTIQNGDNLYSLSRQYNVPLALIMWANPYLDVYNLQVGDKICIPRRVAAMPAYPRRMPFEENDLMEEYSPDYPMEGMPNNQAAPLQPEGMPFPMPEMPPMNNNRMPNNQAAPSQPEGMPFPMPETPPMNNNRMSNDDITVEYVVEGKDTLQSVLERFQITLDQLFKYNELGSIVLNPGTTLIIPERRNE